MTPRHVAGFAAVLAASVALHLAAFVWVPGREGAEATGADGTALVSVEAADAALAELVAAWDAPQPTVFDTAPDAPTPAISDQAPAATGADAAPDPAPLPRIKAPVAAADLPPLPDSLALAAAAPQRAAGGTGDNAGGKQGRATAATQDPGQVQSVKAAWGAAIRARLEAAKRPPTPRRGRQGDPVADHLAVRGACGCAGHGEFRTPRHGSRRHSGRPPRPLSANTGRTDQQQL